MGPLALVAALLAPALSAVAPRAAPAQQQSGHSRAAGRGIPCGRSYISASKACHAATPNAPSPVPPSADTAASIQAGGGSAAGVLPVLDRIALAAPLPAIQDTQRTAAAALWLRVAPDETADEIASVPRGATLDVSSCTAAAGAWCLASYGGHTGYLPRRMLAVADGVASAAVPDPAAPVMSPPRTPRRARRPSSALSIYGTPGGGHPGYYVGPRGGCYTYSASGRKRYVDHSLCR